MFNQDCDWDVPESIQTLNRVVFQITVTGKNKTGKLTRMEKSADLQFREHSSVAVSNFNCKGQRKQQKNEKEKVLAVTVDVKSPRAKSTLKYKTLKATDTNKSASQKMTKSSASPLLLKVSNNCLGSSHSLETNQVTDELCKNKINKDRIINNLNNGSSETSNKVESKKQLQGKKRSSNVLSVSSAQESKKQLKRKPSEHETSVRCEAINMANQVAKRKCIALKSEPVSKKSKTGDLSVVKDDSRIPMSKRPLDVNRLKMHLKKVKQTEQQIDDNIKPLTDTRQDVTLNNRMSCQLNAARFRYINEQLYTCSGSDAAELFCSDRESFDVYHSGFQSQVSKWPVNPVDVMIDYIRHCDKSMVVADFGCGDAKIARSVPNAVHSFDLVALNSHVIACDIKRVPLRSSSVDIVVFCLSLMGTNLIEYLCEASRVLKIGSTLLIAEVVSRFEKIGRFVKKLHKLGFSLVNKDADNKMFVWFEFTKTSQLPSKEQLPAFELLPCIYKKR